MPIYRFNCQCGKKFEEIVKVGTENFKCDCGENAKRVFSANNIRFSVNGFSYSNGYTNQSQKEFDDALSENRRFHDATENQVVEEKFDGI